MEGVRGGREEVEGKREEQSDRGTEKEHGHVSVETVKHLQWSRTEGGGPGRGPSLYKITILYSHLPGPAP